MQYTRLVVRRVGALFAAASILGSMLGSMLGLMLGLGAASQAQELPSYLKTTVAPLTASAGDIARGNLLALNTEMFQLYDNSARIFQQNILAKHPLILALFSGAGGRLILYRPGMAPLDAPSVPPVYQVLKSVGHSTMAVAVAVMPYLESPGDGSWRAPVLAYRSRMQSALDGLDAIEMAADWRANNRMILQNNIAFMDDCVAKGAIAPAAFQEFAKKQGPLLKKNISWAAQTQVAHWMGVVGDWKKLLGSDWDRAYAASNTIYVARQNNILFSVLAQYFGPEAINSRLMLLETISFTATPDDMLTALTRIIADRPVGSAFFGNHYLMDFELMGGDARDAIIAETGKRGMTPFLPPRVSFGSKQWPTLITAGSGPATLADLP